MNYIVENWYLLVAAMAILIFVAVGCVRFFKLPTADQIKNFKEWLKYAVTMAEKELGSKTGQLKLRMVYDMAVAKFPFVGTVLTFEKFSEYVDEALIWFNGQMTLNKAVSTYVEGE